MPEGLQEVAVTHVATDGDFEGNVQTALRESEGDVLLVPQTNSDVVLTPSNADGGVDVASLSDVVQRIATAMRFEHRVRVLGSEAAVHGGHNEIHFVGEGHDAREQEDAWVVRVTKPGVPAPNLPAQNHVQELGRKYADRVLPLLGIGPLNPATAAREAQYIRVHPNIPGARNFNDFVLDESTTLDVYADALQSVFHTIDLVHTDWEHAVVHRDALPKNVLIGTDGNPVLTDLDLADRIGDPLMQKGTRRHPPETRDMPSFPSHQRRSVTPANDSYKFPGYLHLATVTRGWGEDAEQVDLGSPTQDIFYGLGKQNFAEAPVSRFTAAEVSEALKIWRDDLAESDIQESEQKFFALAQKHNDGAGYVKGHESDTAQLEATAAQLVETASSQPDNPSFLSAVAVASMEAGADAYSRLQELSDDDAVDADTIRQSAIDHYTDALLYFKRFLAAKPETSNAIDLAGYMHVTLDRLAELLPDGSAHDAERRQWSQLRLSLSDGQGRNKFVDDIALHSGGEHDIGSLYASLHSTFADRQTGMPVTREDVLSCFSDAQREYWLGEGDSETLDPEERNRSLLFLHHHQMALFEEAQSLDGDVKRDLVQQALVLSDIVLALDENPSPDILVRRAMMMWEMHNLDGESGGDFYRLSADELFKEALQQDATNATHVTGYAGFMLSTSSTRGAEAQQLFQGLPGIYQTDQSLHLQASLLPQDAPERAELLRKAYLRPGVDDENVLLVNSSITSDALAARPPRFAEAAKHIAKVYAHRMLNPIESQQGIEEADRVLQQGISQIMNELDGDASDFRTQLESLRSEAMQLYAVCSDWGNSQSVAEQFYQLALHAGWGSEADAILTELEPTRSEQLASGLYANVLQSDTVEAAAAQVVEHFLPQQTPILGARFISMTEDTADADVAITGFSVVHGQATQEHIFDTEHMTITLDTNRRIIRIPVRSMAHKTAEQVGVLEVVVPDAEQSSENSVLLSQIAAGLLSRVSTRQGFEQIAEQQAKRAGAMGLAADAQKELVPSAPTRFGNAVLHGFCHQGSIDYKAADITKAVVGGDGVGWRNISDDRMFFWDLDISGKDVRAALYQTAVHHTLLRMIDVAKASGEPFDLQVFMMELDSELERIMGDAGFVAYTAGTYDKSTDEVQAYNTGHYPMIIRDGDVIPFPDNLGQTTVLGKGIFEGGILPPYTFTMKPGDRLFAPSDGFHEAEIGPDDKTILGPDGAYAFGRESGHLPFEEFQEAVTHASRFGTDNLSFFTLDRDPE